MTPPNEMTWTKVDQFARRELSAIYAEQIVAWINANGGQARYVSGVEARSHHFSSPHIVITGPNGPVYVAPGDTVVMGEWFHSRNGTPCVKPSTIPHGAVREFTVRPASRFQHRRCAVGGVPVSGLRDRIAICLIVAVSHLGTRAWRKQFHQTITNGLRYRAPVIVCPNCGAVDSDE